MKIFVAGHTGMVGRAIRRKLRTRDVHLITAPRELLDLCDQAAVRAFMRHEGPDVVIHAAARVGGIAANSRYPADFLYENLMMAANVIHASHEVGVGRLLFLGSSCIYPRSAPQPIAEEALMTGALEPSNAPYAVAKIAGIKLCESYARQHGADFRALMPTNLYGPGDRFDLERGHVLPALLRRFHESREAGAREVKVWGTGRPLREFLHVDDLADAVLFTLDLDRQAFKEATAQTGGFLNVGSGEEVSIRDLAMLVARITGFTGRVTFDPTRPDGTPRKRLDTRRLERLGWRAGIGLEEGIRTTYSWFLAQGAGDVRMAAGAGR